MPSGVVEAKRGWVSWSRSHREQGIWGRSSHCWLVNGWGWDQCRDHVEKQIQEELRRKTAEHGDWYRGKASKESKMMFGFSTDSPRRVSKDLELAAVPGSSSQGQAGLVCQCPGYLPPSSLGWRALTPACPGSASCTVTRYVCPDLSQAGRTLQPGTPESTCTRVQSWRWRLTGALLHGR